MAVDDQVPVGTVLVLADLGGQQRCLGELRKSRGEKGPRTRDAFLRGGSIGARRIDRLAARVVGDFETAAVDVGNAVDDALAEIDPDRKVAGEVAFRPTR